MEKENKSKALRYAGAHNFNYKQQEYFERAQKISDTSFALNVSLTSI